MGALLITPFLAVLILWGIIVWIGLILRLIRKPGEDYSPGCSFLMAQVSVAVVSGGLFGFLWELDQPVMWIIGFANVALLAAFLSLPAGLLVRRICRDRNLKKYLIGAVAGGLVAASLPSAFWAWQSRPSRLIRLIIRDGRLANLPSSATDVKVSVWDTGFTGSSYLSFTAPAEDIDAFIAASPSIRDVEPQVFDPDHMHLPYPVDVQSVEFDSPHEYFWPDTCAPSWYDVTIREKGRKYKIPPANGFHNSGSVIIDDTTCKVYIEVIWS